MVAYVKRQPRLFVLDHGAMRMDKNWLVSVHNPATVENPHVKAEFIDIPIYSVLVDHPDGKILFDASCNPNSMGEHGRWPMSQQKLFPWAATEACYLPNRLEQLNISPSDIRYVVASHLHCDHAGCLELFKNATIIVHEDELNAALQSYLCRNDESFVWADIDAWVQSHLNWRLVRRDEPVLPLLDGIRVLNFGSGHSYGMLGMQVNLPETGSILLASDAVYSSDTYDGVAVPGAVYDTVGYRATVRRIQSIARDTNAIVWCGHDNQQYQLLRKSDVGYYE
ncbi:N-acyl homoserine lactonase family protein [Alicyclobacillus fastidiosus]|uniref:N-acyl homoserine lactonase family protein n=1 Tax=Alicyclobacillus fastidiosus TaxID=392011 RepID=A0ABV5AEH2_9BACL|nr:N-acyl homoserine lactonase family protein [Alicyclobacillus fastidiosus]WEH09758.1 N-acyl homoserine lactonase family protein [Alicyclobacillus fastidiosus]